jgi:hypothetical protein
MLTINNCSGGGGEGGGGGGEGRDSATSLQLTEDYIYDYVSYIMIE